ncbi:hypothetical protein ACSTB5_11885, partial [Faecalibacterium duncaniae]|uniref:hypothetical protein n=1 Tax=Faecalibacterium duncaniae (strain DSM 17677 / JCM 31915 / A2-165) TaxID=411483 RepID=UPI003ED86BFF
NLLGHGLQTPFRMVCGNFILPEFCKPCLFLCLFLFAQLIVPYQQMIQKSPRSPVTETGAVHLHYLCFFKRSRNYLRGFLIAAWAGAKIAGRSIYSTMTLIITE